MLKQRKRVQTVRLAFLRTVFTCLIVFSIVSCGSGSSSPTPTATSPAPTVTNSATPSPTPAPFKVSGVELVVSPASVVGISCESSITLIYVATFHMVPPSTAGGRIQFLYTWNGGHASPDASVYVGPGDATATFTFAITTEPLFFGIGQVIVTSPNQIASPQVKVGGACVK